MSQTASPEVVERFKEGFECWNGGELDLMQDSYAEDGELDLSSVFTDTRPFHGREDMRRQWDEIWEAWQGVRMDPLEVFDVGDGRFVVDVRLWGKGSEAGPRWTNALPTSTHSAWPTRRSSDASCFSPSRPRWIPRQPRRRLPKAADQDRAAAPVRGKAAA